MLILKRGIGGKGFLGTNRLIKLNPFNPVTFINHQMMVVQTCVRLEVFEMLRCKATAQAVTMNSLLHLSWSKRDEASSCE